MIKEIKKFIEQLSWIPINQRFYVETVFASDDYRGSKYIEDKCKEKLGYYKDSRSYMWSGVDSVNDYDFRFKIEDKWRRIRNKENKDTELFGEEYEKYIIDEANLRGIKELKDIAERLKKARLCVEVEKLIKETDKRWLDYIARIKNNQKKSFCHSRYYRPGVLIKVRKKKDLFYNGDNTDVEYKEETLLIGDITTGDAYGSCGNPYLENDDFIISCKEIL